MEAMVEVLEKINNIVMGTSLNIQVIKLANRLIKENKKNISKNLKCY